jgi:hypothetical protein
MADAPDVTGSPMADASEMIGPATFDAQTVTGLTMADAPDMNGPATRIRSDESATPVTSGGGY